MAKEDINVVYDFISEDECNAILEYEKYLTDTDLWDKSEPKADPSQHW